MLSRDEAGRIATAISTVRPDWRPEQILGVLKDDRIRLARTYRETFHAALEIAIDPQTRQPTRLLEPGPWWRFLEPGKAKDNRIDFGTACLVCLQPEHEHPIPHDDHHYQHPKDRRPAPMPDETRRLLEEGRRLASQREDLIAGGADPAELEIPIAPATKEDGR